MKQVNVVQWMTINDDLTLCLIAKSKKGERYGEKFLQEIVRPAIKEKLEKQRK
ncbi:hypothetical protein LCGC14_0783530 [marine sediment metagenome]|uniref:Uncharacterized protein n=1 Tax=marine sediment metagenome TaxID=412755 RepID=A0A0F9PV04_9ZZZZ